MPRYQIIHNPLANRGSSQKDISQAEIFLNQQQIDYCITPTRHPWHAAKLAEEAVLNGYDVIVAAGGDGTVNEVLNGMMLAKSVRPDHRAVLGVLPIGRGNDFAFSMGIPASLEESCTALAQRHCRRIDVGWMCGGLYPEGRYFGNGIGIGFDAVVGFVAARNRYLRGFASYIWAAIKTISLYFDAPEIEIIGDDWNVQQRCLMVSIMNGRRMGGGFMMTPDSQPDDELLDLCLVGELNQFQTLTLIPTFFSGTQYQHKAVDHKQSTRLHIKATRGNLPAHADGETLCTDGKELTIELLPAQLDLIYQPENQEISS